MMKVQAINPMVSTINCQPIRPVKFAGRNAAEDYMNEQILNNPEDSFSQSKTDILEQKYDLACRLAAYYKQKYEEIKNGDGCLA